MACDRCGSYAINPEMHGREPKMYLGLCDVCYWRFKAEQSLSQLSIADRLADAVLDSRTGWAKCASIAAEYMEGKGK